MENGRYPTPFEHAAVSFNLAPAERIPQFYRLWDNCLANARRLRSGAVGFKRHEGLLNGAAGWLCLPTTFKFRWDLFEDNVSCLWSFV